MNYIAIQLIKLGLWLVEFTPQGHKQVEKVMNKWVDELNKTYWKKQMYMICYQHEAGDIVYLSMPPQYKCKKCGAMYVKHNQPPHTMQEKTYTITKVKEGWKCIGEHKFWQTFGSTPTQALEAYITKEL